MRYILRRHLFLSLGLLSLALFFLVAILDRAGQVGTANALAIPMRILIIPMYLVWLVLTMAHVAISGPTDTTPFAAVWQFASFLAGLAPYVLLDYLRSLAQSRHLKRRI